MKKQTKIIEPSLAQVMKLFKLCVKCQKNAHLAVYDMCEPCEAQENSELGSDEVISGDEYNY